MSIENNPMDNPEMPPQYGQPQYQQPYQSPVQSHPNMGLFIVACIAHLIFCAYMFLVAFEVIYYIDSKLGIAMLMLGTLSSLLIFDGYRVYCKSRLISAPCKLLILSQIIYTFIFLLIEIDHSVIYYYSSLTLLCGIMFILAFLLMLIGRLIVGGKLLGSHQPVVGLMMIAVAVSQILMIVRGIIYAKVLRYYHFYDAVVAMQRLGVVTWIYIIATTLESLLAIFVFASKDK